MNELLLRMLAWAAGIGLGAAYFGGLWLTVRRGLASPRPVAWFFTSMVLRMGLVLAGFYLVSGGQWDRLLLCLLGFVMARVVVTRLTRSPENPPARTPREVADAPQP
jgi:F1F0 ATPase subunit 2